MRFRRVASVICLSLALCSASSFCPTVYAAQTNLATEAALLDDLNTKLSGLINEFYNKKAKITKTENRIRVEYKVRPFVSVGNKQELAPDFGGLACDIELKPGPYTGKTRLPQQYNEHNFYSVILMAPYSKSLNAHLYTKLLYPSDTQQEFLDRFKDLLNEYDDAVEAAAPASRSVETATASAVPTGAPAPAIESSRAESAKTKQIFWKATRGNEVAYIVGTIPYRQSSGKALTMASEIKDAFKDAKSVIVDTIDLRTSLPYSDKLVRYESGDKLSKHLSSEAARAMDAYLKWSGETMEMYDFWKPWFAAVAFENSSYRLNGFDRVEWEKFIADRAKKEAKPVYEMESAENKVKLFEALAPDKQDKLLTLSIKELMGFEETQKDLEKAWRAGDAERLDLISNRELAANADLKACFEELKEARTNQLSKKIDEELKNGSPVFVAADARNLVGEDGLINRLAEKGFSVEQVVSAIGVAASKPASESTDAPVAFGAARLSRYTYPEGKFSVMLPGKPATRYTTKTGMRQVEYILQDTQGAYCVGYIILPGVPQASAIPTAFDATANGLKASYRAVESKESPATLQGYPGRIVNITKIKDKTDWGVHVRMFVVGKMLYILAAEGTTAWLRSPTVHQVSNSLTVVTPADEMRAKLRSNPTPSWPSNAGASKTGWPPPSFDTGSKNRGEFSPRGTKWGADQHGPTSPWNRNRHNWGGNN
jgi:uncharacterized protein YbaP (TraB family)